MGNYRKTMKSNGPPSRIYISRLGDELEADILLLYKGKEFNLRASPKVRFEGEVGVGSGPVREFFSLSMQLLEGIQSHFGMENRVLLFEGQDDHKVPRQQPLLRQTGLFVAAGRMIAHSALHGGPGLHRLSPAVIHYWAVEDFSSEEMSGNRPPVGLWDIPDVSLRDILNQVLVDLIKNIKMLFTVQMYLNYPLPLAESPIYK